MSYEIEIPQLDETIRALGGYDATANKHLRTGMLKSVIHIQGNVRPLTPVGVSGRLRNSITYSVTTAAGSGVVGKVGSNLEEEYPAVMEYGRKPGNMPPPQALERWVQLVMGVNAKDVAGVAFVVARAIGRKGIKGRKFLERGWQKSQMMVNGFFVKALDDIVEELARGR